MADGGKSAFPALTRLREEGVIDGWGMGVNSRQPILRCLEVADSDVHLLASQYSLIDHATAVEQVLPKAREKGVSFVVGSALNAGFLGVGPSLPNHACSLMNVTGSVRSIRDAASRTRSGSRSGPISTRNVLIRRNAA